MSISFSAGTRKTTTVRRGLPQITALSAALLLSAQAASAQSATVYKVGALQPYTTLSAAVAAAESSGGTADIQVDPGTYTNDFPQTITGTITIEGVGGLARFVATVPPPNLKSILDVSGNVTLRYLELTGTAISDSDGANGAGIRYENGTLVVQNCFIHDNQDGLLSNADPNGTITVDHTELSHNGVETGPRAGYEHNLYIGEIARLTLTDSFSHDAAVGHEVKSRALVTDIENSRIYDNSGDSSYSVDAPNGGTLTIKNSVIEQGAHGGNPNIFAVGEEGNVYPGSRVLIIGSTIVNDLTASNANGFLNPNGITITDESNNLFGISVDAFDPGATNVTVLATRPTLDMSSPIQPATRSSLSPSSLSFAATPLGETSAAQTITLTNAAGSGVQFSSASFSGVPNDFPAFTNCSFPLNPGQSCTGQFSFTPSAAGLRSATLNIFSSGSSAASATATFTGTGLAETPLTFSSTAVSFPPTSVGGTSEAIAVQVTNPNSTVIYLNAAAFVGAAAGDFAVPSNSCPTALPAHFACAFTVTFSPTVSGTRNAGLSIATSATASPQVVPLSGLGVDGGVLSVP